MGAFDTTIGPLLIGSFLNIFLFGITVSQFHSYVTSPYMTTDSWWINFVVMSVFSLDVVHTVVDMIGTYHRSITHFGDIVHIDLVTWTFVLPLACASAITFIVNHFFAIRILRFSSQRWLAAIIIMLAWATMLSTLATAIGYGIINSWSHSWKIEPALLTACGCAMTVDIVVSVALVYHLRQRKTGMERTDDILSRIVVFTVQTGIATTLSSLLILVLYLCYPDTTYITIFLAPHPKLYSVSVLSSLNMRQAWTTPNTPVAMLDQSYVGTKGARSRHQSRMGVEVSVIKTTVEDIEFTSLDTVRELPESYTPSSQYEPQKGQTLDHPFQGVHSTRLGVNSGDIGRYDVPFTPRNRSSGTHDDGTKVGVDINQMPEGLKYDETQSYSTEGGERDIKVSGTEYDH